MTIRAPGQMVVYPPSVRKRWWGLRSQRIPETVHFIAWHLDGPVNFPKDWDLFVAAAQEAGTYVDHRPADRYGLLIDQWAAA